MAYRHDRQAMWVLVSGACFADFGHQVTCVDKDEGKIAALRRGEIPIFEPGLDVLVATMRRPAPLKFTTDLPARAEADAVFHRGRHARPRLGDGHAEPSLRLRCRARDRRAVKLHGRDYEVDRAGRHHRRRVSSAFSAMPILG